MKTNVDISIKINHRNRHFVQMLKRREYGTSVLIGQTQKFPCAYTAFRFHTTQAHKHKEKEEFWSSSFCLRLRVFTVK